MRGPGSTDGDDSFGSRVTAWRTERPLTGVLLLWAASAMLVLVAIRPATIQITDTSLRGPVASVGALTVAVAGGVALARPGRATAAGGVGAATTLVTVPTVVALGSVGGVTEMLLAVVVFGAAGGIGCVTWRLDHDRDEDVPSIEHHLGAVSILFALLVVTSSGAATAGEFPRQLETYGGMIVKLDTLEADAYDFEDRSGECVAGRRSDCIDHVARQELDGVQGTNFELYENLQEPDGTWLTVAVRGEEITSTGDRGFDAYVSEYYNDYMEAELEIIVLDVGIDEIQDYWVCDPGEADGFGSIDDTRLGIDASPELENGEDIYQLAHQLGTSNTVIQNFELEINESRRSGMTIQKDAPNNASECD